MLMERNVLIVSIVFKLGLGHFISNIPIEFAAFHHVPMADSMPWLTTQKETNPNAYLLIFCTI